MVEKTIHKMGNSYSIYLPMDWVKGISGNKVFLRTDPTGNLIISSSKEGKLPREKEMHVEHYDFDLVNRIITWAYRCGYDKFTLTFGKQISTNQILKHKEKFEAWGLPLEIEEMSSAHFKFYFQQPFISPRTVMEHSLNLALNVVRAKEQKETKFVDMNYKSLQRNRHIMKRIMISALIDPSLLTDFNVNLKECFDMDTFMQHFEWTCEIVMKNDISAKDLENLKKIFEDVKSFYEKKTFSALWNYHTTVKKIEHKHLFEELWRMHRLLVSSWIC